MKKVRKERGITLIALVITIIVLLILAGVSLSFIAGENGILGRATKAVDKNNEASAKEQVQLLIADYQAQWYEAKYVNGTESRKQQEYILDKLEGGATTESYYVETVNKENGTVNVYKGNDNSGDVILSLIIQEDGTIQWKKGPIIVPQITAQNITAGSVLQGEMIEIQVEASIKEGNVTITAPENMVLKSKTLETEQKKIYVYTVSENGSYTIMANGEDGQKSTTIKVNNIIDKPRINISNNTGTAITVNVENDYPEDANVTYTYYLGGTAKATNLPDKSYIMDNLTEETEYTIKVVINYKGTLLESDEMKVSTIGIPAVPKTTLTSLEQNSEKVILEYPFLTLDGIMNCKINCKKGDKVRIEMENTESATNYYSIDNGENWIEYTKTVEISYPGDGLLKAKAVNSLGSSKVKDINGYIYDDNFNCTAQDAVTKEAYDGDYDTYYNKNGGVGYIEVDPSLGDVKISVWIDSVDAAWCNTYICSVSNEGIESPRRGFYSYEGKRSFEYQVPADSAKIKFETQANSYVYEIVINK